LSFVNELESIFVGLWLLGYFYGLLDEEKDEPWFSFENLCECLSPNSGWLRVYGDVMQR